MFAPNPDFDDIDRIHAIPARNIPDMPTLSIGMMPHNRIIKQRMMYYFDQFTKQWPYKQELEIVSMVSEVLVSEGYITKEELTPILDRVFEAARDKIEILGAEEPFNAFVDEEKTRLDEDYERLYGETSRLTVHTFIIYGYFGAVDKNGRIPDFDDYWENEVPQHHKDLCPAVLHLEQKKHMGEWYPLDPVRHRDASTERFANEQLGLLMQQNMANVAFDKRESARRKERMILAHQRRKEAEAARTGATYIQTLDPVTGRLTDPFGEKAKEAALWADTEEGKSITAMREQINAQKGEVDVSTLSEESLQQMQHASIAASVRHAVERASK